MGVETEAPEETVIFLSQERMVLRPPNSILPAHHRLPQLRIRELGCAPHLVRGGLLWGGGAEVAGRAPNSGMSSDGEPLRQAQGDEGWGARETGRWLAWTPGDLDRTEKREDGR